MATTELTFDADHPVPDRYHPAPSGELDAIGEVLADGRLAGGAPVVAVYEQALARWFRAARAVAVNSGTSALHATLTALNVKPGTEVLVPAIAPLPTAMPILTCGATPVIVGTRPGSLALDPADVERKLTERTRAAITLPLWGYPNDDHAAATVLTEAGVPVVEDACQAHGTTMGGCYAGTRVAAGCFSTHDRKPLATGEGGFVLTNDPELADRIDFYTHLGHLRGRVHGVNYKLAAPLAAIGLRRLTRLRAQLDARRRNAQRILDRLPPDGLLHELPYRDGDRPNYYNLVLTATSRQREIAAALEALGLPPDSSRYRYRALQQQPLFTEFASACPNAEALATSTFQLPVHPNLSEATVEWVAAHVDAIARGGTTP
jgi:dTDP-4-amino-4,6-dideoxygalactose transaminase